MEHVIVLPNVLPHAPPSCQDLFLFMLHQACCKDAIIYLDNRVPKILKFHIIPIFKIYISQYRKRTYSPVSNRSNVSFIFFKNMRYSYLILERNKISICSFHIRKIWLCEALLRFQFELEWHSFKKNSDSHWIIR